MDFRILPLPSAPFAPLFAMTDADLSARRAQRSIVTESPGVPCRVSLQDAALGETVILINHMHLPAESPYRAAHAIYVREGAVEAELSVNAVPEVLRRRVISVRQFDAEDCMIAADLVPGEALCAALSETFDTQTVAYVHLHYAAPGCFAAVAQRAG